MRKRSTRTLEIYLTKKSVVNKAKRISKTAQHFKNLLYIIARLYFEESGSIQPFTKLVFLEKFVKGKEFLDTQNTSIQELQTQLIKLWKEQLGSDTAKAIVKQVAQEFRSVIGKWQRGERTSLPHPRKLNKLHHFTLHTNPNMVVDKGKLKKRENAIVVRLGKSFGAIKAKIPPNLEIRDIKVTWLEDVAVIVKISYWKEKAERVELDSEKWLAIDLGINNLIGAVSNVEDMRSFLINGKALKAINQWANKTVAKLQSEGKYSEARRVWDFRNRKIKAFIHQATNIIAEVVKAWQIGTVIVGKSLVYAYSRNSNKGKRFNQNFRNIPIGFLLKVLKYKLEGMGAKLIEVEERNTSRTSSITGNLNKEPNGSRVKRGLFIDKILNKAFNADLNGALNIAIKASGMKARKTFLKCKNWLDKLARPVKIHIEKYPANCSVIRAIAGSLPAGQSPPRRTSGNKLLCFV